MATAEWIAFGRMLTGMLGVWHMAWGPAEVRRAGDQREKCEDGRHREVMRALEAIIKGMETVVERTARPPEGYAMTRLKAGLG